jgi:predicted GIY-YIG superfamily endonuclease
MAWTYILRGASGRLYIGSTENLERRIAEHRRGSNHTTRRFGSSVELVAARKLPSISEARKLEIALKRKRIRSLHCSYCDHRMIYESSPESFRGWFRVRVPADPFSVVCTRAKSDSIFKTTSELM